MKARTILLGLMLLPLFCAIGLPARAQVGSSQQTLNQYVVDLQNNPNDTALRERIIALAQTVNPPPDVPSEARRHMSRGVAAVEDAKTPDDFKDACNEFQQATTLAPWLANGYRNLAIAQDKAGMYDEALTSLRLYLLTRPSSTDADWAEDLKSKVEYRKERIAKAKEEENSPQAAAAREQKSFEDLLSRMDGRRYTGSDGLCWVNVLDIKGRSFVPGQIGHPNCPAVHQGYAGSVPFEIQGRVTSHTDVGSNAVLEFTYTINENGNSITVHTKTTVTSGPNNGHVYDMDDVYR